MEEYVKPPRPRVASRGLKQGHGGLAQPCATSHNLARLWGSHAAVASGNCNGLGGASHDRDWLAGASLNCDRLAGASLDRDELAGPHATTMGSRGPRAAVAGSRGHRATTVRSKSYYFETYRYGMIQYQNHIVSIAD